jgi:hypothetical protein
MGDFEFLGDFDESVEMILLGVLATMLALNCLLIDLDRLTTPPSEIKPHKCNLPVPSLAALKVFIITSFLLSSPFLMV